ncbi:MAG: hypothetical protein KBI30_03270 [Candidatus Atribacteria bacterium]|nr:hypothetical protein [Candidatus Atribacteria bacterium]
MDYDTILVNLREINRIPSYDLLIAIEKILMHSNINILLSELQVFSGVALRFLYRYDFPLAFNDIEFVSYNLQNFLDFDLRIDSIEKIPDINPPFVIFPENALVIEKNGSTLKMEHNFERYSKETTSIDKASKIAYFERIRDVERSELYDLKKFHTIIRIFKENFFKTSINVKEKEVFVGKAAFIMFMDDLKNEERLFSNTAQLNLTYSIPAQLSALFGLNAYILGIYHFLDRKEQDIMNEGLASLNDAIMFYGEFERILRGNNMQLKINVRRQLFNSLKRFSASLEHFVYTIERFIK